VSDASERVLLLAGSPKGLEKSNSARLGRVIVNGLEERGWTSESIHLHAAVAKEEGRRELFEAVGRADVVLFAAPLYVDSLPAPAIRALELIAAHRRARDVTRMPRFVSIITCGFVEPSQNDTCQRILQRFVGQIGFEWVAEVSLGGSGRISKRIQRAFDILIEALDLEILFPGEVEWTMRKPLMPGWLYVLGGNIGWKRLADKNGVKDRLRAQPYKQPDS
jgi:hypothetical protein